MTRRLAKKVLDLCALDLANARPSGRIVPSDACILAACYRLPEHPVSYALATYFFGVNAAWPPSRKDPR